MRPFNVSTTMQSAPGPVAEMVTNMPGKRMETDYELGKD